MTGREPSMGEALELAAFCFRVDRVTAEVTTALREASIPSMLLKGPGIATWLYGAERPRIYTDSDLLLRRRDWEKALALIEGLGFEDDLGPLDHPRMESGAGYPWVRQADGAHVDLHHTVFGIRADPDELWAAFWEEAVSEKIGGLEVSLPSRPARLLHIALHAVQHGPAWEKPMADLRQGIARAPIDAWMKAFALAERLEAADTFAAGIRLTAEGRELAEAIGAGQGANVEAALRLDWVPTAEGFRELSEADGIRERAAILFRELFPTPTFMRWWSSLARRGRLGLALAYLWRPLYLFSRAIPGYLAWRRASRAKR
ncbi:MAG TPA: nucleotidyltransferase family protein [Solirubrobacterales bacterium]|nr:nucleotidyltransferase family protein [Solirubrobacterales bacterium]